MQHQLVPVVLQVVEVVVEGPEAADPEEVVPGVSPPHWSLKNQQPEKFFWEAF